MDLIAAQRAWEQALGELELEMTPATFNTWLRGTAVVAAQGDVVTVAVRHAYAVDWMQNRLLSGMQANLARTMPGITVTFAPPGGPVEAAEDDDPAEIPDDPDPQPAPIPRIFADFDPNTASAGGFAMIGNYANAFWAAYLGTVAWRVYQIVYAHDKRRDKGEWTRPRSYTISHLARSVPTSRNAIRGRWRATDGQRRWRPGAFDVLAREGLAQVHWHDNDPRWRRWHPGGAGGRGDATGQRIIYRLSVRTVLPLLTPRQVAALPADLRHDHEAYLVAQDLDVMLWEQIDRPTLAPVDETVISGARAPVTGALAPVAPPFFCDHPETSEDE